MVDYKNKIAEAKKYYLSLDKVIFCKSLKRDIQVSRLALDHLLDFGRTLKQVYFRSKVIYYIQSIIEKSVFYQYHRESSHNGIDTHYWSFQSVLKGVCSEIILRQVGNQPTQIYSMIYRGGMPDRSKKIKKHKK